MSTKVGIELEFTEDEFELLSFEKKGDIIESMLKHSDWDIQVLKVELSEEE